MFGNLVEPHHDETGHHDRRWWFVIVPISALVSGYAIVAIWQTLAVVWNYANHL